MMNDAYIIIGIWGVFLIVSGFLLIKFVQDWEDHKKDDYINRDDYIIDDFYRPKD